MAAPRTGWAQQRPCPFRPLPSALPAPSLAPAIPLPPSASPRTPLFTLALSFLPFATSASTVAPRHSYYLPYPTHFTSSALRPPFLPAPLPSSSSSFPARVHALNSRPANA